VGWRWSGVLGLAVGFGPSAVRGSSIFLIFLIFRFLFNLQIQTKSNSVLRLQYKLHVHHKSFSLNVKIYYCRLFDPGGVPGPTSKLSLRVPAQMGRRETEHKGENSKGKPRPRVVLRPGQMRLQ
jgi:hypothetical protein